MQLDFPSTKDLALAGLRLESSHLPLLGGDTLLTSLIKCSEFCGDLHIKAYNMKNLLEIHEHHGKLILM